MERWLHQHIFKLGWLLTRNFNVTTVLYYLLFLPGIVLHEVVLWLVAGALNVHATRTIEWPHSQEIGELRLNFVRIAPNIPRWKRFVIALSPLVAGMLLTWHIAENVFQLDTVFSMMSSGALTDIGAALERLLAIPDFWLWFYLLFTVSNTMFASLQRDLNNAQSLLAFMSLVVVAIVLVGATSATFSYVASPFENALSVLTELVVVLIAVNFFMTVLLGTVESVIERFSSHTVTFRAGRMETAPRQPTTSGRAARARAHQRSRPRLDPKAPAITSVYKLAFPIPGGPSRETNDQLRPSLDSPVKSSDRSRSAKPASPKLTLVPPQPPVEASLSSLLRGEAPTDDAALTREPVDLPQPAGAVNAAVADMNEPPTEAAAEPSPEAVSAGVTETPTELPAADESSVPEADDALEPSEPPLAVADEPAIDLEASQADTAEPTLPASSPLTAPTTKASEDDEDSGTPSPAPSPFGVSRFRAASFTPPASPAARDEADAKPAPASSPFRSFAAPPFNAKPSPFTSSQAQAPDDPLSDPSQELPDPFSEAPAKPAAPRNPLYARISPHTNPFGQMRPAAKPSRAENKQDAEEASPFISSSRDLSYEVDEDYYSEGDDE